jgi:hypothetical protein
MDSDVMQDRTDELLDEEDGGATLVLTEAGWETTDYLDPGDDWGRLPDGSYLSPDGLIRTWPAGAG